jgi:alkanesulfonate monooxygenase SsuD/methylene tetrahydromethanopterin reductase-like flavin-dependent oxidoreductase (luciferase family)
VELGILLTDVNATTPPAQHFSDMRRVAEAAQRNGFTYLALGQHFLYGDVRWLQPVPTLARLAADVDAHVKLMTNVMIGPLYHPVMLAEEIATLDVVTEGRFTLGIGLGYREPEFGWLDVPFKERAPRLDETIALLKKLWTEDEVTFDGRFWKLDGVRPHLKPVQQPHPRIWVGGTAPAGAKRAGRLGDGYLASPEADAAEMRHRFELVKEGFDARGKAFCPQPVRRNFMFGDDIDDAAQRYVAASSDRYKVFAQTGLASAFNDGDFGDLTEQVKHHTILGTGQDMIDQITAMSAALPIDPLILRPQWPSTTADAAIDLLDRFGEEVMPAVKDIVPLQDLPMQS